MRTIAEAVLLMGLAATATTAGESVPKPLPPPPPGFKVLDDGGTAKAMRETGVADAVRAEKPNTNWPNCISDPKIRLSYSWTAAPAAGSTVEVMAQAPEEPAKEVGLMKDEPAGKRKHKGGVLVWRSTTTRWAGTAGACREDALVTHTGTWTGFVTGRLLGVGVDNLYGPKEIGQAWIDEYIDKVVAAVTGQR